MGGSPASLPTSRPPTRRRSTTPTAGWASPASSTRTPTSASTPPGRERRDREPGRRQWRRDDDAHLLPDRAVLSQPRRRLRRLLSRGARALPGPLPLRLRLPPGADRRLARRRDGDAGPAARRAVLQDLHVLRRLRAARPGR